MGSPGGLSPAAERLWKQLKDVDLRKKTEDSHHLALVVEGTVEYDGVYYLAEEAHSGKPFWWGDAERKVIYWESSWVGNWTIGEDSDVPLRQRPIIAAKKCEDITECNAWVDSQTSNPMPVKIVPYTRHPKIVSHLEQRTHRMEAQLSFVVSWVARAIRQEMTKLEEIEIRRRTAFARALASEHTEGLRLLASAFAQEAAIVELQGEERLARGVVLIDALSTVEAAGRSIVDQSE
eukprot:Hpha_TRINITY_DN15665_c2_g2::TRINITY_DN15665_c2_g2_i1::g.99275::m.99275